MRFCGLCADAILGGAERASGADGEPGATSRALISRALISRAPILAL